MKQIFIPILIILTLGAIILGNIHWNQTVTSTDAYNKEVSPSEAVKSDSNLPSAIESIPNKEIQKVFKQAAENEETVKIVFLGSNALGSGTNSWPEMVGTTLKEEFNNQVAFKTLKYDMTSLQFVQQDKVADLIKEQPDIVLFEPFTLNNNGEVSTEDSRKTIQDTINSAKESKKNTLFILQPTHPIPNATIYPSQVEELNSFAQDNGYLYLNHWANWPDYKTEEIKEYLNEDRSAPNEKGHKVWADTVLDLFIK
ncbi:SGNH/GDSL hydrolase family protein [Peribacillus deserti]|uniref:SGNH/GDSL hydrolase family protein n=1 Tax=Peribacillus deserti TaxID=673318 RepID=A0A2N5MBT9_9BACI|nr:SGNH/GDSL hydrolase family protein [Peribacillus deserti]PLT31775.1 hypothetical protein CUU66_01030 [Peribacillus deserti]